MVVSPLMHMPTYAKPITFHGSIAHHLKLPLIQIALLGVGSHRKLSIMRLVTVASFWACCIMLGIVVCKSNIKEQPLLSPHTL